MTVEITKQGKLFAAKPFQKAIEAAVDKTAQFCLIELRGITPVRTGQLRSGWVLHKDGWNSISLDNLVPYAIFVDQKLSLISQVQDGVQIQLKSNLLASVQRAIK